MTLASSRIVVQGETPYAHEREAIEFAIQTLPNSDPYHIWALLELLDPSTGRLYELDLLVLGYSALYLVEVKSGPGIYEGDTQDWYRTDPADPRSRYMENPFRLTNHKAKVLASRLRSKLKNSRDMPWVEPLVFLSAEDIDLRFRNYGDRGVVTRQSFLRAVQHHDIAGVDATRQRRRISAPAARNIAAAIKALGLRPRKGKAHAGSYELGEILEDGPGYQDRVATHRTQRTITCRARTYLVPQQTSVARRQQLRRAADRESRLLYDVREHANVLRIAGYETDAPLGPTVLFDSFDGGVPLSTFLRQHPDLSFLDRVSIVEQVGRALGFCHRKKVVHGALCPEAVLVRQRGEHAALEVRLFNFQLGTGMEVEATTHWSALASEPWAIYQAPELREDPGARSPQSDVFSLGALAYLVFTGRAPGETFVDVARLLHEHRFLDPRAVDDGILESVADLVCLATQVSPIARADDADEWVELLLQEVTQPDAPHAEPDLDPLEARPGDNLGEDLLVERVLGQGATSRVLQVARVSDGRSYALKVALSEDHAERLAHEADTLAALRHPRIVQLVDRHRFAERSCLLLSVAGSETLHRHLAKEGAISLDLAARYGDDLLSTLEYLEEQQVSHRDIKPANLGVGVVGKTAAHLTLFDFSLAFTGKTELQVGTAAYRDPFLSLRGSWDNAAERWSAAVTLHEMLTGTRPSFEGTALDTESKLLLAAERFDPSVRDVLTAFFERALARDIERRFVSAEEMRRAWIAALEVPTRVETEQAAASPPSVYPEPDARPSDDQLAAISASTLVEALPLSPRAKNALDRAGMLRAEDLLDLADNRLSAIRGIGMRVAEEILEFRNRWRELRELSAVSAKPFFAGYRGDDLRVGATVLDEATRSALADAGLGSLAPVAAAPSHQLEALSQRHGFDLAALRVLLEAENGRANERERPSTLEGWVESVFPKRKRRMKRARQLYGLEGEFLGRIDLAVRQLAEHEGVTTPAIYIAMGKARAEWAKHSALPELTAETHAVVDAASGALPLEQAALQLLARVPHDRSASDELLRAQAAALFRVVIEVEKEADGLRYMRLGGGTPWVCVSDAHARALKALGHAADELAARPVLAGQGETARVFAETVAGTPLASVAAERLAELAAQASASAARSTRLEIYPRGMPNERALSLSATLLRSELTPEEVRRRVSLRYPDAEPLPGRPELDALLKAHGLVWDEAARRYHRHGAERTTFHTRVSSLGRTATALPSQALSMEPDAVVARQFDDRLRNAVERRYLRVLGVRADRARAAALAIGERIGAKPVPLDRLLVQAIRDQMHKGGVVADAIVHDADRAGPRGKAWPNLLKLVQAAADAVLDDLLPPEEPLLLVQPGLLARYQLTGFLERLVQAAKVPEAASILLLVPSHDTGGIPRINGDLAIPGLLPSQALWVAPEWLANRHNAPA